MTRVLYVDEAYGFGGSTTSLLALLEHLDAGRYEGTVVVSYPLSVLQRRAAGMRLVSVPVRPAGLPGRRRRGGMIAARRQFLRWVAGDVLPRAAALVRLGKRDHVALVHVNNGLRINLAGILAARFLRVPCVAHIRGFERIGPITPWCFRRTACCIAVSEAIRSHMLRARLDRGKIVRVYDGLTPSELARRCDGTSVRRELGLPDDVPIYGLIGMLMHWKGQRLFLEAARRIQRVVPEALGLIIGDTPIPGDPYRQELEEYAGTLGLNGGVRFLGFWDDPWAAYALFDVVVHASTDPEPFGRVIIEAMAAGRPVVAADAGGPLETVVPGETGLLFAPGDAGALADVVITLLRDASLRKRFGEAGRRRAAEAFRMEDAAASVQTLYDRVLGR